MKIQKIIKIIILIIIAILIFCFVMKNFFPAEWSFITPHKQGDFVRVGNMHHPMYGHNMILLDDGRVFIYVAGNVEVYNPKTRRFKNISRNGYKLSYKPAVVKLQDGRIMMIGGTNGNTTYPYTYFFDPKTNKITKGPDMITGRERTSAVLLKDGRVFVSGGEYYDDEKRRKNIKPYFLKLKSAEFYNPKTNKFEKAPDLLQERRNHMMILTNDGEVLIFSGFGVITEKDTIECPHFLEVEKYIPQDNKIILAGKIASDRFTFDLMKMKSGDIYLTEGYGKSSFESARTIEKYDPKMNISTIVNKRTSSPGFVSTALLPDDTILFYGGSAGFSIGYTSHNNAQIYNPKTNKFTDDKSKIPVNLYEGSRSVLLKDGNLLITGGGHDGLKYAVIYMTKDKIER